MESLINATRSATTSLPQAGAGLRGLRRILVPVDGASFSEHALEWALELAHHADATIDLASVNVLPPSVILGDLASASRWEHTARDHSAAYLDELAEAIGRRDDVRIETTLLRDTSAANALARHCRQRSVDLVVMTTHGRRGVARAWLGSVAEALVRELPVPALLVRPEPGAPPPRRARRDRMFRRVLVAMDGSRNAECALEFANLMAGMSGARLDLLRVVDSTALTPVSDVPPATQVVAAAIENERITAAEYLARHSVALQRRGSIVAPRVEVAPDAAGTILGVAAEAASDLIVVGTQGRRGLRRVLLGSVAEEVVRSTTLPVLVVPVGYRGPLC